MPGENGRVAALLSFTLSLVKIRCPTAADLSFSRSASPESFRVDHLGRVGSRPSTGRLDRDLEFDCEETGQWEIAQFVVTRGMQPSLARYFHCPRSAEQRACARVSAEPDSHPKAGVVDLQPDHDRARFLLHQESATCGRASLAARL